LVKDACSFAKISNNKSAAARKPAVYMQKYCTFPFLHFSFSLIFFPSSLFSLLVSFCKKTVINGSAISVRLSGFADIPYFSGRLLRIYSVVNSIWKSFTLLLHYAFMLFIFLIFL